MCATELHCVENLLHEEKERGRPHKKRPLHSNMLPDSGHFLHIKGKKAHINLSNSNIKYGGGGGGGGGKKCRRSTRQEI